MIEDFKGSGSKFSANFAVLSYKDFDPYNQTNRKKDLIQSILSISMLPIRLT